VSWQRHSALLPPLPVVHPACQSLHVHAMHQLEKTSHAIMDK
jgi:hypothetical protein